MSVDTDSVSAPEPVLEGTAELVRRYSGLVYGTAMRKVRDPHLAEDVAQAVFMVLHRRRPTFDRHIHIEAWLHRTTCYAAENAMRIQRRAAHHEQKAAAMTRDEMQAVDPTWRELEPLLDQALQELPDRYREALLLRFFQQYSFPQVGQSLGTSEEAARKLVNRGVEKLKEIFARSGVVASSVVITNLLDSNLPAAPQALVNAIIETLAGGKAASPLAAEIARTTGVSSVPKLAVVTTAVLGGIGLVLCAVLFWPGPASPAGSAAPPAPTAAKSPATVTPDGPADVSRRVMLALASGRPEDVQVIEQSAFVAGDRDQRLLHALTKLLIASNRARAATVERFGPLGKEPMIKFAAGDLVATAARVSDANLDSIHGDIAKVIVDGWVNELFLRNGRWQVCMFHADLALAKDNPSAFDQMEAGMQRQAEAYGRAEAAIREGEAANLDEVVEIVRRELNQASGQ